MHWLTRTISRTQQALTTFWCAYLYLPFTKMIILVILEITGSLLMCVVWWQILSLGAGQADLKHELAKARKWGMTGWVRPLMNIMMEGTAGEHILFIAYVETVLILFKHDLIKH